LASLEEKNPNLKIEGKRVLSNLNDTNGTKSRKFEQIPGLEQGWGKEKES